MRNIFLLLFGLVIFLVGCSSTYTLKDFPSKQKFYEEYNNFAENKKVKITLLYNKSFYTNNKTEIINDTLYIKNKIQIKNNYTIPTSNIEKIDYLDTGYKEANILLINGQELRAENISFLKDSINLNEIKTLTVKKLLMPLDKIKNISYKNHWLGVPLRLITGTILGFAAGWITANIIGDNNLTTDEALYLIYSPTVIGTIAGAIWGWIDGYTYTYQFNP